MGLVGASIGVGNIFGPALGGVLSEVSLSFPFVISSIMAFLNFLAVAVFVKESLVKEARKTELRYSRPSLLEGLKTPLKGLLIVMLMVSISETTHQWIFALYSEGKLGLTVQLIGWAFTGAGIASALVQGLLVGRFIGWLGEEKTARLGMTITIVSFGLLLIIQSYIAVVALMTTIAFGLGLIRPSIFAAVSRRTSTEQGKTMGILQGYDSLGRGVGPPLGGFMLDQNLHYGYLEALIVMGLAWLTLRFLVKPYNGQKTALVKASD
jgi:DHA1 family multidrug resistance protein-like MFS transporter